MRTFNYHSLPQNLFVGNVGDATIKIHQDQGRLDLLEGLHPELLEPMKAETHIENVDASTRIEGIYVDRKRIAEIVSGSEPTIETEAQIAGYSNALRIAQERAEELDVATSTILKLFETLYAHRDLGRRSRYRKKDYMYVQVDGHPQAVPVSPISAFETPLVLGGACDSLAEALEASGCSPLVLASVFTVDFLCIRPFDEGNGRVARLTAELMLEKAGFHIARYESIDRIIEASAMDYYDALNACVNQWDQARNDYSPYAAYWLDAIHEAYQRLFEKVDLLLNSNNSKTKRVRLYVQQKREGITKRQILEEFPDISEATVENALGCMVKDGELQKVGAGRATSYRVIV